MKLTDQVISLLAARIARKTIEVYGPWKGGPETRWQGSAMLEVNLWTTLQHQIKDDIERGEVLTSGYVYRLMKECLKILNKNAVKSQGQRLSKMDLDPDRLIKEERADRDA